MGCINFHFYFFSATKGWGVLSFLFATRLRKKKISDNEMMQDLTDAMTSHNNVFNPKGVAYVIGQDAPKRSGEDDAAAAGSAAKRRKLEPWTSTLEEVKKTSKQQLVEIAHPQGACFVTADGQIFFQAKENAQLLPSGPAICLCYGKFFLNEEAGPSC